MSELFIRDNASKLMAQLADTLERLVDRLSPTLLARVLDALERVVESVERPGEFLRVVTSDSDLCPAGTGDHIADVQLSERFRDFIAALSAFDRDLELVCKAHGFLCEPSSPMAREEDSCANATENPSSGEAP